MPLPTQSALSLYESSISAASAGVPIAWQDLADRLRAEAADMTGSQRTKRIDRALDCETRALARRTAEAFHREQASRKALPATALIVRDVASVRQRFARHLLAMGDFVPGGVS